MSGWTVQDVIDALPVKGGGISVALPRPALDAATDSCWKLGLAVESMRRHTTDEGFQLFQALQHAGYALAGKDCQVDQTDVRELLTWTGGFRSQGTVVVQDKREWMGLTADRSRDPAMRFTNVSALQERPDIFRAGVVKDAQNDAALHRESAEEAGFHAWLHYYNPRVVCHLLPFLRPRDMIRTWHTLDKNLVPPFTTEGRDGVIISGAVSGAYPLRERLVREWSRLPDCHVLQHPGYHRNGCQTPLYLRVLSRFEVSICTASRWGYSLRKLMESTACGCRVLTDLPEDEVVPGIDKNFVRVRPGCPTATVAAVLRDMLDSYDPERQREMAEEAKRRYDWRSEGARLAASIEEARKSYNGG